MDGNWHVQNKHYVVLRDSDSNTIVPTAEEVFLSQFKKNNLIRGLRVKKPSEELGAITFSKLPVEVKVVLNPVTSNENIDIHADVMVNIHNEYFHVGDLWDLKVDHIIIENTWFPFVKGALSEITQLLTESGIEKPGRITVKQYLSLKKQESPAVIDRMLELSIDKGQFISNKDVEIPLFAGNLYPYQNQGYRWLKMIVNDHAGCILADEMGLGKTAQIIAVLASESILAKDPSLVVAPVSLLENWRREVEKFAPTLKVKIHQGHDRTGFYSEFKNYDLVVTSYETILRDLSMLLMLKWNIVVADEAQAIKNPGAKRTRAIKQIERNSTIAVTGTPFENRLMDLWSLSDFVLPGYMGELRDFQEVFPDDMDSAERLEPLLSPILLRRRVKDVAGDLPERIDIPQVLKMSQEEANMYDSLRREIIETYGKQASLVSLIKLRMYCTHPFLQDHVRQADPSSFGKYLRLIEILEEIIANKEKVIIFTSYTQMADILVADLKRRFAIFCDFIDGRVNVSERQLKIDRFSEIKDSAILVLNPRAAGAGLNITAANHVIHYNLEWNPAIEDQASARAHRRGQTRPVTVYRLFYKDTVEELINEKLERKRNLSDTAVIGTDGTKSNNKDILDALLKSPLK